MAVIFDLDQTLIDSVSVAHYRQPGRWREVYPRIPYLQPYAGIADLLTALRVRHVPLGIVTSSPESYCARVVRHWGWHFDAIVCFHDTKRHKPDPAPILLALDRLNVTAAAAVSVGDDAKDITAARRAGVFSIGVLWGAQDKQLLLDAHPDMVCETVAALRDFLFQRFP